MAKGLLGLMSALITLAACESLLRWIDYRYTPLTIVTVQAGTEWRHVHAFTDRHFVYDPVLIWRPRSGTAPFNSHGFRGPEISRDKRSDTLRVVALGDSNTLGWLDEDDGNWPTELQAILARKYPTIEVVNGGVYGYSSFQGLGRFREILPFAPDVVLISFGLNDAARVTVTDSEFVNRGIRRLDLDQVLVKIRLGQLILQATDGSLAQSRTNLTRRVGLAEYSHNLEEFVRLARGHGVRVVLLTRPVTGESSAREWDDNFDPAYNAKLLEVARRLNVPCIDVYAAFRDKGQYFEDETHFTEEGHVMMARLVAQRIERLLSDSARSSEARGVKPPRRIDSVEICS
jgi:lysophospholipase L1-like esterase